MKRCPQLSSPLSGPHDFLYFRTAVRDSVLYLQEQRDKTAVAHSRLSFAAVRHYHELVDHLPHVYLPEEVVMYGFFTELSMLAGAVCHCFEAARSRSPSPTLLCLLPPISLSSSVN